jgi:hypothetical protein
VLHWHEERHHCSPHMQAEQLRVCDPDWYSQAFPGLNWHALHAHDPVQTCCEHGSQLPARVAPAAHAPSPEHVPQVHELVHVCVPQLPHACV